jgi:hypothetical protein
MAQQARGAQRDFATSIPAVPITQQHAAPKDLDQYIKDPWPGKIWH